MLPWLSLTGVVGTTPYQFSLRVNTRELILSADRESIEVTMPGPGEDGSMDFTVQDPTSSIVIQEWDHVEFEEYAATRPKQFGGFVMSVTTSSWAAGGRTHRVRCSGYGVLLDRKWVAGFEPFATFSYQGPIGPLLQMLITRFGGIITAPGYVADDTDHDVIATVTATVLISQDWRTGFSGLGGDGRVDRTTLRQALRQWATLGHDWRQTPLPVSVPYVEWVDAYARYHATWIPSDGPDDSFEGAIAATTDSSNPPQEDSEIEGDGNDYATSVWVEDDPGTDDPDESTMIRGAPHPVAGDIEVAVSVRGGGGLLDLVETTGAHELELRAGSTVRATLNRTSDTPLDIRPGMSLSWTSTQLSLSTQEFRVLGVKITYLGGSRRRYAMSVGGRLAPSFARETATVRQSLRGRFRIS